MPQASKTFRIFVSSTFSDLKDERNALQEYVFPRLRELCAQHGCRFQAIDLRWGIRDEVALDQQTMKICLEEIARCQRTTPRPNFIVLLGDRYGWRPLPPEIPAAEFEEISQSVSDRRDDELLRRWYKRDDNAVPPAYVLQPREGEYASAENWDGIEQQLRIIVLSAISKIALLETEELKYVSSATEQEIVNGALNVPDARNHVFCFFRSITDFDSQTSEFRLGSDFCDTSEHEPRTGEARARLIDLKERLRFSLGNNIHEYEAEWRYGRLSKNHIGSLPSTLDGCLKLKFDGGRSTNLCEDVWGQLSRVMLKEMARIQELDPLETEAAEHQAFGAERARHFVGRATALRGVTDYLAGARNEPLVIYGASGSGKSAFIAQAASDARQKFPRAVVITRFIGATPASADCHALLAGVCNEISRRCRQGDVEAPADFESLSEELSKHLSLATQNKPIILFLDSLDQLSNTHNARNLRWLPVNLPPHSHVVVSTTPGDCLSALERKVTSESLAELPPMDAGDGRRLLDKWLTDAGRTLQPDQRQAVLEHFSENGLPLYLKLAFEEARRWPSFRERVQRGRDVPEILRDMFRRLEEHHGKIFVSHGLGYLAAARNGLTEDELLDLLARDHEFYADFKAHAHHDLPQAAGARKLPVAVWSRLYFDLEPYLTERNEDGTSLLSFYHRQLNDAVVERYLPDDIRVERHRSLAGYFGEQKLKTEEDHQQVPNVRKVSELPYHQTHGELWRELEHSLCDLDFVEAKCAAGRTYDLAADYHAVLSAKGFRRDEHPAIEEFARFVRSQSRALATRSDLIFQQAANEPENSRPARAASLKWSRGEVDQPWLRLINKDAEGSAHLMKLVGHMSAIDACVFSPDGNRILTASRDGTIKLWDSATGENLATMGRLQYSDHPVAAAFAPDGTRIISAHSDGRVHLWQAATGTEISSLLHKSGKVLACGFVEGRAAFITLSGSLGWSLEICDAQTGEKLNTMRDFGHKVRVCVISPDGNLLASASQKNLKLWNARTGKPLFGLGGFKDPIEHCGFSQDGSLVFASDKNQARLWDCCSGTAVSTLANIRTVALSPDGKVAVAAERSEMKLCDTANGGTLAEMRGDDWIRVCAFSPDGKRFVAGSNRNTATVWDATSRARLRETPSENAVTIDTSGLQFRNRIHTTFVSDLLFWDELTGREKRSSSLSLGSFHYMAMHLFSPDATRAALISDEDAVLWDTRVDKKVGGLRGNRGSIKCACFSPDGALLVTGLKDTTLKLWDAKTCAELATLRGHDYPVDACVFTPDGSRIFSSAIGGTRVWDSRTAREIDGLYDPLCRVVALSPDGRSALISETEVDRAWRDVEALELEKAIIRKIKIVDLASWSTVTSFSEPWGEIEEAAFSPDGKWILVAARDEPLWLRHASTGEVLCQIPESYDQVQWSPDGKRFVVVSRWSNTRGLFELENLTPGPIIVTAWIAPSDGSCAVGCPLCRRWSDIALEDLGSETECSHCQEALQLNGFVTRAEWHPLRAAWQGKSTRPKSNAFD
jgi:WD40 repeat protein